MNSNEELYGVEFTEDCIEEIKETYEYISQKLIAKLPAKRLMQKIERAVMLLERNPQIYIELNITDKLKRKYRRMVINNYVLLYTIDEENRKVYVSHMYYGKRNYLE